YPLCIFLYSPVALPHNTVLAGFDAVPVTGYPFVDHGHFPAIENTKHFCLRPLQKLPEPAFTGITMTLDPPFCNQRLQKFGYPVTVSQPLIDSPSPDPAVIGVNKAILALSLQDIHHVLLDIE